MLMAIIKAINAPIRATMIVPPIARTAKNQLDKPAAKFPCVGINLLQQIGVRYGIVALCLRLLLEGHPIDFSLPYLYCTLSILYVISVVI